MDFEWVATALNDVAWIALAFGLGFLASIVRLPPLVGYLATGFILNYVGFEGGDVLQKLADLGITLLLFTVGLKLDLKSLSRPQIWGSTLIHMALITASFGALIFVLAMIGLPLVSGLGFGQCLLIAFALSFSSTVFVVKVLEERGEMSSRHGRISIGILIMQDLVAVIFLAITAGKVPSIWALGLLLLIPAGYLFKMVLEKAGHGELLILYGLVLALGGYQVFDLVSVKGDLGALFMGILLSTHPKAKELANSMLGFKDLFLVGFFLTIGLAGDLTLLTLVAGLLLVPLIAIKSALFIKILTKMKLRARTSLLATLNLSNYSEFGLIVMAIGVSSGWLEGEWLIVSAIALSASLILGAPVNQAANTIYSKYLDYWHSLERRERLPDDDVLDTKNAQVAVFGMGRVGAGAYQELTEVQGKSVVGVDLDSLLINKHKEAGLNVLVGNPGDPDFWEKIQHNKKFELVLLALPNFQAILSAVQHLKHMQHPAVIAAVVRYEDEEETLREEGVSEVFNIYSAAGAGFAEHVINHYEKQHTQHQQPATS